jgi:hypothetical protein
LGVYKIKELILLFIAFAIFLYGVFSLLRDCTKKLIAVRLEIKKEKERGKIDIACTSAD